ncbi:unnamed protein product [marine sediment metagenome]|uniref:Uncharacterized protein n=1 Tax=marine sediment metagenome TaxID=412755 RepID=X1N6J2_9ZZZZ
MPAKVSPMAIPLFLANHLGIVEVIGIKQQLIPIPIKSPQTKYTCHNELICDIKKKPIPVNSPLSVTKIRGPYLSLSLPLRIEKSPDISINIEKAPDSAPLSQPNSIVRGTKNTPNA